jgi:hypothetical protein
MRLLSDVETGLFFLEMKKMSQVGFGGGTRQLGADETALIVEARLQGLDPQQLLLKDLLLKYDVCLVEEADAKVRRLGPEKSAQLKELIQKLIKNNSGKPIPVDMVREAVNTSFEIIVSEELVT